MKKMFMGARLRRLREERGLTQVAAANAIGVSASYYNQLENDQRPLTRPLLLRASAVLEVEPEFFSEEDEARLLADLREALTASAPAETLSAGELRELVSRQPAVARALLAVHRREREAAERAKVLAARLGDAAHVLSGAPLMPFEEVRDFFYSRHNYFHELDLPAECIAAELEDETGDRCARLTNRLTKKHGVRVDIVASEGDALESHRRFRPQERRLLLAHHLNPGQRAFQLATQLALLEASDVIQSLVREAPLSGDEARLLARLGLAHHFAGALLMPYGKFLSAAESLRYDIDRLCQRFDVGFETICHRLSTLQRSDARGVPFFFVRVDRAGNISKRQSATDFHFSRVGGTCPLWNVYEAFARPGQILTQLAQMPDGRVYLWVARTVSHGHGGFGTPGKTFAIGLGCDVSHAPRLVYSQGLNLKDPAAYTPIGVGCKVCERVGCPQRAFPPLGRPLAVDENESRFAPYPVA